MHLYGPERPPIWLDNLRTGVRFLYHNSHRLFPTQELPRAGRGVVSTAHRTRGAHPDSQSTFLVQPWGQWDWPLTLSTPERALLELLDELPE